MLNWILGQNKEKRKTEKKRLIKLRDILNEFQQMPTSKEEGYESVIMFFNVISRFQDNGKVEFAKNSDEINALINQTGRQAYGWNRTTKGEAVTYDNFFVGDRYGLFTKSLRHWMFSDSVYEGFFQRWHPEVARKVTSDPFDWQVILYWIIEPFIVEKKKLLVKALNKGIESL